MKVLRYKKQFLWTGLLSPLRKVCSFDRFPTGLDRLDIEDLVKDKDRAKIDKVFPPKDRVRNQGNRGSCNGYAAAKALEVAREKAGLERVELSGEYLYSRINGGRDNGSMLDDGMNELMKNGVAPFRPEHYEKYRPGNFTNDDKERAKEFKALECHGVKTENELAEALALGYVCVIAVHASNNYMKIDRSGVCGKSLGPGNHAEYAADIRIKNGEFQFLKYGSWGTDIWKNGAGWITWKDHLRESARNHYFYAIRVTG